MADEYESQSWKDRCDRYFSSISDTEKDRDQEKHANNESENTREKRADNGWLGNDLKEWKDLSEVRNALSEHWILRNARKAVSVLDVHGSKIANKTKSCLGFIFWLIIVLISIIALGVLLYFVLKDFIGKPTTYRIKSISESQSLGSSDITLTICNLNVIRKSKLEGSGLSDLDYLIKGKTEAIQTDRKTVKDEIEANKKLKEFLHGKITEKLSDFISNIENDIAVQELTKMSNLSLLYRLSKFGKPDLLKSVVQLSNVDIQKTGHVVNEMLIKCWKDNRLCLPLEIITNTDPDFGNCLTIPTLSNTETVELILNAQSEEYIDFLSSSVGFAVSVGTYSLPSHVMKISPGFHSTISINKLTTINRLERSCSLPGLSIKTCESNCLKDHVVELCGCTMGGKDVKTNLCKMNQTSDHICVKSVRRLKLGGNLPCKCQEICREKKYDLQKSTVRWPSRKYTELYGNILLPSHPNVTQSFLRDNLAVLTVNLIPEISEEIEEHESIEIIDIFVRIGGLSALVAGVSVITVLELLYMIIQGVARSANYIRKGSRSVTSPQRLSDSEITSITWAMYRQRRRFEEVNKTKEDKVANNAGVNALGGNAQARILKRSSYAENREPKLERMDSSNDNRARQNGYFRRHDGKNCSKTREIRAQDYQAHTGDNNINSNYKMNAIHLPRQHNYIYDNHQEPVYSGNVYLPNGVKYKDKNVVQRHQSEDVFLYNGAVAYFNPTQVSEPVYL